MQKGLHNWPKQLEPCDDVLLKHLEKLRGVYGMQVYDIDPYVGVFQLRENLWAMFVPCTHVMADNWAYLLEGPEKAVFIDNGFGIGDLRGLGEMLTGKPVITAVTHEHGDHYGGSVQWDEIYCHEYCADTLNSMSDEDMERGLHNFMEGKEDTRKYWKDEDVMPFRRFKAIGLKDHETISLGGDHELEVLHVGGHAQGLCCFLDKKNRYLFTGDSIYEGRECGVGTVLTGARPGTKHPEVLDIHYFTKKVEEITARVGEYDWYFCGHGYTDTKAERALDLPKVLHRIINNPLGADAETFNLHGHILARQHYGDAWVSYNPEKIK